MTSATTVLGAQGSLWRNNGRNGCPYDMTWDMQKAVHSSMSYHPGTVYRRPDRRSHVTGSPKLGQLLSQVTEPAVPRDKPFVARAPDGWPSLSQVIPHASTPSCYAFPKLYDIGRFALPNKLLHSMQRVIIVKWGEIWCDRVRKIASYTEV